MTSRAWTLLVVYGGVLLLLAIPTGRYITRVMEGRLPFAARVETESRVRLYFPP